MKKINTAIKILIAEHDTHDLAMIDNELKKAGIDFVSEIVKNEAGYRKAVKNFIPDVILCDYTFPSFDGPTAFKIREQIAPETPFILISGTIGEENSIELIKNGVTDLVLKDRMFTLCTKVIRALNDGNVRKEKNKAAQDLKKGQASLIKAQAITKTGSWETDLSSLEVTWSEETYRIFGVDQNNFGASHAAFLQFIHPDDVDTVDLAFRTSFNKKLVNTIEHRIITPAGLIKYVEECWQMFFDEQDKPVRAVGTCQDITERKNAERQKDFEKASNEALINSTEDAIWSVSKDFKLITANKAFTNSIEKAVGKIPLPGDNVLNREIYPAAFLAFWEACYKKALQGTTFKEELYIPAFKSGAAIWLEVSFNPIYTEDTIIGIACYSRNITEAKSAADKIKESEARLAASQSVAKIGSWETDLTNLDVIWSDEACRIFGVDNCLPRTSHQNFLTFIHPDDKEKVNEAFTASLTSDSFNSIEHRIISADGILKEVEERWNIAIDDNGKPIRAMGTVQDITERKKADKAVKESEAKYRAFFENSIDGILLTVTDGNVLAANPAACRIFNMTEQEICDAGSFGLVDLSDPRVENLIKERQLTGKAQGELTFLRKDGTTFAGEISSVLFTDSFGLERTSMIIRDISERKETEDRLALTSGKLQSTLNDLTNILDSSLDVICAVDEQGIFKKVSAASEAVWGYKPTELIGKPIINFIYPEDHTKTLAKAGHVMAGNSNYYFENRYIRKDGSLVSMEWSSRWDKKAGLRYGVARDVTEKKRLEKAIDIERQRFLGLYLYSPSCMGILKGPNHVYETANPLYLQLIGKTDIIGKPVKEVLPEMEAQGILEILDNVYKTGETFSANEMLVQFDFKGSGELVDTYLNFIYQAHRDNQNEINGILFFAIDVTEQVVSRKKIEESENRYRQIVETAQEGIWLIDENHKTTFVNNKMCEIFGYTEAEMMGKDIYFFMDEEGKKIAADLMAMRKDGHTGQHYFKYITKSGKEIWTNLSANPLFDEKGVYKGSLAMVTDITHIKKAEKRDQFQATLLNTIGQATIATDMQGKINFWNKAASAIYGWTEEEVLGKIITEITPSQQTKEEAEQIMQELLQGNSWSGEFVVSRKDGSEFPAFVTNAPIYDQQRQLIGIIGVSSDITNRKQAELRLKESIERYNLVSQATNDMVFDWDLITGKVFRNKEGWKKIFRTGENVIANDLIDDWVSKVHPEDMDKVKRIIEEIHNSTKDFFEVECRVLRDDGTYAFIHDRGNILRNEQGKAVRLIGATQDITVRKEAEIQVAKSELRFRSLVQNSTDLTSILDERGYYIYCSPAVKGVLGYEPEFMLGKNAFAFIHPGDINSIVAYLEKMNTTTSQKVFAFRYKNAAGEWRWLESKVRKVIEPDVEGYITNSRDITERKLAEEKLIKSNRLYAFISAINHSIVHIKEEDELLQKACSIAMEIGNFKIAWIGLLNAEDKLEVINFGEETAITQVVEKRSGMDVQNSPYQNTGVDKALRNGIYVVSNDVLNDPDMHFLKEELLNTGIRASIVFPIKKSGKVTGVFSFNSDTVNFFDEAEIVLLQEATNNISFAIENFDKAKQHKKAEEKIIESEKDIRTMAESMPQIVWKTTAEGKYIYFNQQWVDYTGLTLEESYGDGWLIPFHKDDKPLAWSAWNSAVINLVGYTVECRLRKYDGSYHWWLMRGVPKINERGEIEKWFGTYTDIEKIKQTEERLKKQASDLAVSNAELEQFAYVTSHDLQEPLRMVTIFLTQLEKKYGDVIDDKGKQYIGFAVDGAKRMRKIIQDLLEFSRVGRTKDDKEMVDLNELIDEIRILLRRKIDEQKAVINIDQLPTLHTERSLLHHVFQNLIDNALKYSNEEIPVQIHITAKELKDHWQFAVIDNGIGIGKEYFEKIFIIFQRLHNKDEYSGTGIGLAITKKIIETEGGKIWVKSEEGKGSTFCFTIKK